MTSRVQGPCTDSHAKNPEGELAQNASQRGDFKRERAQHVNCVNNCERFLPEGPFLTPDPEDPKPDWQPPVRRRDTPGGFLKMKPGTRHLKRYLKDLQEQPQDLEYCQVDHLPNMDEGRDQEDLMDSFPQGTDRIQEDDGSELPMDVQKAREEWQAQRLELEAGSPPWRTFASRYKELEEQVDITIAGRQVWSSPGEGPEVTVLSARVWTAYVKQARHSGIDIQDYDAYRRMTRVQRVYKRRNVIIDGINIHTHGPFKCWVRVGSSSIKTEVYVTSDAEMSRTIAPGKNLWQTLPVMICRSERMHEAQAVIEGKKEFFRGLLDTGAGPNIITREAFLRMGHQKKDILPTITTLSMADSTRMRVFGEAKVDFRIIRQPVSVRCVIVEELGGEDIVLGRDFFRDYDVILDLMRRRLTMANAAGEYQVRPSYSEKTPAHRQRGMTSQKCAIEPEEIKVVRCKVQPMGRRTRGRMTHVGGTWMALAEGERGNHLQNKGVAAPRALVMVRNGEVHLPLLNVREKGGRKSHLPGGYGHIVIRPVHQEYERVRTKPVSKSARQQVYRIEMDEQGRPTLARPGDEAEIKSAREELHGVQPTWTLPPEEKKTFVTRPPTEHLTEIIKPEVMDGLNEILEEHADLFSKNKSDIGLVQGTEHDIEIIPGQLRFETERDISLPPRRPRSRIKSRASWMKE